MKLRSGWWCPEVLSGPHRYLQRSASLPPQVALARGAAVAVQAGGHIGIYPRILSDHFEQVLTFEPDADNFACLTKNLAGSRGIFARRGFLSDTRLPRALLRSKRSSGGHHIGGVGKIPCFRIDDLGLSALDAVFLDVEGFELFVLRGALKALKKFRPLLVLEENKKARSYRVSPGDLLALVAPLGYIEVAAEGEDIVLAPLADEAGTF